MRFETQWNLGLQARHQHTPPGPWRFPEWLWKRNIIAKRWFSYLQMLLHKSCLYPLDVVRISLVSNELLVIKICRHGSCHAWDVAKRSVTLVDGMSRDRQPLNAVWCVPEVRIHKYCWRTQTLWNDNSFDTSRRNARYSQEVLRDCRDTQPRPTRAGPENMRGGCHHGHMVTTGTWRWWHFQRELVHASEFKISTACRLNAPERRGACLLPDGLPEKTQVDLASNSRRRGPFLAGKHTLTSRVKGEVYLLRLRTGSSYRRGSPGRSGSTSPLAWALLRSGTPPTRILSEDHWQGPRTRFACSDEAPPHPTPTVSPRGARTSPLQNWGHNAAWDITPRCAVALFGAALAQSGIELVEVSRCLLLTFKECLEKSASVVASDPARVVTVFTCFSRASVFSRVRWMGSL